MRITLTFIHQRYCRNYWRCQPRLRMRLICPLVMLIAAATLASSGKARIGRAQAAAMPSLRGEAATKYLKRQGLYSSLRKAVKAARYGVYPSSTREGDPTSSEIKKLTASDGANGDFFGASVAIHGNAAIVGASGHGIGGNINQGSAYISERNRGGAGNWGEAKKLTASDGVEQDLLGDSVAIHEDTAIVGTLEFGNDFRGSAYIFSATAPGCCQ
jgi:FG-GAP repeat